MLPDIARRCRRAALIAVLPAVSALLVWLLLLHPRPADVMPDIARKYRSLSFYADHTRVDVPAFQRSGAYRISFARPNRLRLEFSGIADDLVVVSDGRTLYKYLPARDEYTAEPAPNPLPSEFPTGQPSITLALLNGRPIFPDRARLRYGWRRSCGAARWAHVFIAQAPSPDAPGVNTIALTVDGDLLVHCASVLVHLGDEAVTYDLTHSEITTAPPPEGTFRFEPPPSARRVESISP